MTSAIATQQRPPPLHLPAGAQVPAGDAQMPAAGAVHPHMPAPAGLQVPGAAAAGLGGGRRCEPDPEF